MAETPFSGLRFGAALAAAGVAPAPRPVATVRVAVAFTEETCAGMPAGAAGSAATGASTSAATGASAGLLVAWVGMAEGAGLGAGFALARFLVVPFCSGGAASSAASFAPFFDLPFFLLATFP